MIFSEFAPSAKPVFYRTYSRRKPNGKRESFREVRERTIAALAELGNLTEEEVELIERHFKELIVLPSGRWLWVGGTEWLKNPNNFYGAYNCCSLVIETWEDFGRNFDFLMQGVGVGAILEPKNLARLPMITNVINLNVVGQFGTFSPDNRREKTGSYRNKNEVVLFVGDSRKGWVDTLVSLLRLSSGLSPKGHINLTIDISNVRGAGELLKGFGGHSNPSQLVNLFKRVAEITNGAIGRRLNSLEACLILDESGKTVVAGNIRRSAGMKQGSPDDGVFTTAKDNLWEEVDGQWRIDPRRDALRMSNHTRVYHTKPSLEDCIAAVRKQYHFGEGAIQWAGEAIARANADILGETTSCLTFKTLFLKQYPLGLGEIVFKNAFLGHYGFTINDDELEHRINRYGINPCGEELGSNFLCNLSEVFVNNLPKNEAFHQEAFEASALIVCSLLHHQFPDRKMQESREIDPRVGVGISGIFDFFVNKFGDEYLQWWKEGRSLENDGYKFHWEEQRILKKWRSFVENKVTDYCNRHSLKRPNRCTTVQPSGTKSLLTGASPGWHVPYSNCFIRRITFSKNNPVALACLDYGYRAIPADKDENGVLLPEDAIHDPRCNEWLIEIPTRAKWADKAEMLGINVMDFSALAKFDFYMQVQTCWTASNTSGTINFEEDEIIPLATAIHEAIDKDKGYISVALLAKSKETFPRMPFEAIDLATYNRLMSEVTNRRRSDNFEKLLEKYDSQENELTGPGACDSDACLFPAK